MIIDTDALYTFYCLVYLSNFEFRMSYSSLGFHKGDLFLEFITYGTKYIFHQSTHE